MGKSRSTKSRRVTPDNANRRLPRSTTTLPYSYVTPDPPPRRNLRVYEDRREWHPDRVRPAASFSQPRHRLRSVVRAAMHPTGLAKSLFSSSFEQVPARIGFVNPKKVLICVRRNIRKQIMHALGRAGKKGQKKPRRNAYSQISCKSKRRS